MITPSPIKTRPAWLMELIAAWGFAQRNYFLTKRYFLWEVVWLAYTTLFRSIVPSQRSQLTVSDRMSKIIER